MDILLVEDDLPIARMLQFWLKRWEHQVTLAHNGEQALELAGKYHYPIVITDWVMPRLSGLELVKQLREDPAYSSAHMIMLTARTETEDLVNALAAGADDFLTKPVNAEELKARVRAGQRIAELQQSLEYRNDQLQRYVDDLAAANSRMQNDLNAAVKIQQAFIPEAPPNDPRLNIQWHFQPCAELAGDTLNFTQLDDSHYALYVLDVTGHGVPAALLSVTISHSLHEKPNHASLLKPRTPSGGRRIASPAQVADALNRRFPWNAQRGQFFTLLYLIYNADTGHCQFTCAGHPGPIHLKADGQVEPIDCAGFPIGLAPEPYSTHQVQLAPGDRLFLFSDGALDAMDRQRNIYGLERTCTLLQQYRHLSLAKAVAIWRDDIDQFAEQALNDDLSILALERCKSSPQTPINLQ